MTHTPAPPTDEPTLTPTSASTATATASPTGTEAILPPQPLVVIDAGSDGVDCAFGTPLETTNPAIDIFLTTFLSNADSVEIRVGFDPDLDIAAAIAALGLPYSIQVGVADPEFPFPPVAEGAWSRDWLNAAFLGVWLGSQEPTANLAAQYRDGAWIQEPGPSPAAIAFTGEYTATFTIPNTALPEAGSMYVNTVIDNRFCDVVGANDQGANVRFVASEEWIIFTEGQE
jgi:hypothetical protein